MSSASARNVAIADATIAAMTQGDRPRAVTKVVAKKFPKGKIVKVEEVTEEDDKVLYELVIKVGDARAKEVVFSPNGKIIEADDEEADDEGKKKEKGEEGDKKAKKQDKDGDDDKKAQKKEKDDEGRDKDRKDDDEKGEKKPRG